MENNKKYFIKYQFYKNKYLKIKNKYNQIGSGPASIVTIKIYDFKDEYMNLHFNPIYGLYMCKSGHILNILYYSSFVKYCISKLKIIGHNLLTWALLNKSKI